MEVSEGRSLSLVGGDLNIEGDVDANFSSALVYAPHGSVNMVSVAGTGEVVLQEQGDLMRLEPSSINEWGDISITQGAFVSTSAESGGEIVIRGGRLTIDQAYVMSNTNGAVDGNAVAVDIQLAGDLEVINGSAIAADSYGAGNAGDLILFSNNLYLAGLPQIVPSTIRSLSNASGDAGDIHVNTGYLEILNAAWISADSPNVELGKSGDVIVNAQDVYISGPESSPDPFGSDFTGMSAWCGWGGGAGGNLRITTESLTLTNRASLDASSYGTGNGGLLEITAQDIAILNGSNLLSSAFGQGDGGLLTVTSDAMRISGVSPEIFTDITGTQSLSPSGIASQTGLNGGSAGGVQLNVGELEILDGGRLSVETFGPGNGGQIDIQADRLLISGVNSELADLLISNNADPIFASAGIYSGSGSFFLGDAATGDCGGISVSATEIHLSDGGLISSITETPGAGGNIDLAADRITLSSGASIAANSQVQFASITGKAGDIAIDAAMVFSADNSTVTTAADQAEGGNISIAAPDVMLTNQAVVSTESSGPGNAGNIDIIAPHQLTMQNSSITTEALQADGGNVSVTAEYMVHLTNSEITASVGGGVDTTGGNINIDPEFVILNNSQIIANAFEGMGGECSDRLGCVPCGCRQRSGCFFCLGH